MWTDFFFSIGCFDPLCVRSPLDTLESGVLFHIWWLSKQLLVLHDSPPWKVALCLPYPTCTFTPTLARKHGVERSTMKHSSKRMWFTLHVRHIVDYSPSALLPPGELATDGMRFRLGRTFFRDADPHKSFGENLLVYHPWKIEQP